MKRKVVNPIVRKLARPLDEAELNLVCGGYTTIVTTNNDHHRLGQNALDG